MRTAARFSGMIVTCTAMQVISGEQVGGRELADLLSRMVAALNSREIPTAGSILEHFNRELVARVREQYATTLEAIDLPIPQEKLDVAATLAHTEAFRRHAGLPWQCTPYAGPPVGLGSGEAGGGSWAGLMHK